MRELLDTDGENRAVRAFLMYYGATAGITIGKMKTHLRLAGYPNHPTGLDDIHPDSHLTKATAQSWIRYLISLEAEYAINVDALANEIRRVDGNNNLGAGALAEALLPFIHNTVYKNGI